MRLTLAFLLSLVATDALGQGLVPNVLSSNVDQNGRPLAGAKLYVYAANTTTPQTCYTDVGLTLPTTFPVVADNTGRIPLFYCGVGSVHIRLTDASGNLVYDYPSALVIGNSSGGGGGGGSVDPSTVLSTGDIKFRQTSETLTGWIKLNGTTIGSAASGATQRANADTSALYAYLWTNCIQTHCAVTGGRGASASVDFTANKPLAVPDWRGRAPFGLDDMGATARGLNPPIGSGGSDTATTPGAWGGAFNTGIVPANLPAVAPAGTITITANPSIVGIYTPAGGVGITGSYTPAGSVGIGGSFTPSGTVGISGSYTPAGGVSLTTPVTPTFTSSTVTGSQTLNNILTNVGGPVFSGPATAAGGFTSYTVNGSSFGVNVVMNPTTLGDAQFTPRFTGTVQDMSLVLGGTFHGDTIIASTLLTGGFNGTSQDMSLILTGGFTGTSRDMSTVLGVSGGSYSFTGTNLGSAAPFATASPFLLGTWYMKMAARADFHICDILSCNRHDGEDI